MVLKSVIERDAPWAAAKCSAIGQLAGDEAIQELARQANRNIPELKTHDRYGNRIDWVDFHPSWHQLMSLAWQHEIPTLSWTAKEKHPHLARAVLSYLWNQVEQGTGCPTGMAYASYAGFCNEPALKIWAEKSLGTVYENSRREVADKPSVVIGYAMTEKQGGSDLRETQTTAVYSHIRAPDVNAARTSAAAAAALASRIAVLRLRFPKVVVLLPVKAAEYADETLKLLREWAREPDELLPLVSFVYLPRQDSVR